MYHIMGVNKDERHENWPSVTKTDRFFYDGVVERMD